MLGREHSGISWRPLGVFGLLLGIEGFAITPVDETGSASWPERARTPKTTLDEDASLLEIDSFMTRSASSACFKPRTRYTVTRSFFKRGPPSPTPDTLDGRMGVAGLAAHN
jgi:hypothetical protein